MQVIDRLIALTLIYILLHTCPKRSDAKCMVLSKNDVTVYEGCGRKFCDYSSINGLDVQGKRGER
jgi:hypothetical protein